MVKTLPSSSGLGRPALSGETVVQIHGGAPFRQDPKDTVVWFDQTDCKWYWWDIWPGEEVVDHMEGPFDTRIEALQHAAESDHAS